jgi:hypothetical protein
MRIPVASFLNLLYGRRGESALTAVTGNLGSSGLLASGLTAMSVQNVTGSLPSPQKRHFIQRNYPSGLGYWQCI